MSKRNGICARCGEKHDRMNQALCLTCHAAYMAEWRKLNRTTGESRDRQTARAYARTYLKRGLVEIKPCCVCGGEKAEMHHPDHSRPLYVFWLCRTHHLAWHRFERETIEPDFEVWLPQGASAARIGPAEFLSRETYASFLGHPRA